MKYQIRHLSPSGIMLALALPLTFHWCYAFILLSSSATTGNTKLFESGKGYTYQLTSTVILNEPAGRKGKDVGYQIQGDVSLGVVWQNGKDKNEKLLELELKEPKLLIQSKKDPTPHVFNVHKSHLDNINSYPFFLHWKNGKINGIYTDEREESSLENFKKGIASTFQFQVIDVETKETDASGNCLVSYKSIDQLSFSKSKKDCYTSKELESKVKKSSDSVLGGKVSSSRTSTYKLSADLAVLESVTNFEHHEFVMNIKKEAGSTVSATQHLTLNGEPYKVETFQSSSLESAVKKLANARKLNLKTNDLQLQAFPQNCDKEDCPSLPKLLKENREQLSGSNLGTFKSAAAFIKLLSASRTSTKAELIKAYKGSKNKEILTQLCDLAGAIQSQDSHETIMKIINFDSEKDFDQSERYLWALAAGSNPQESVINDIFKISQRKHSNEKLDETILLTLASMTHKFSKIPGNDKHPLVKDVVNSITRELEMCKDEYCKMKYLRALKNLKLPETIPVLINHALNGKPKISVEAMKGIRSFEPVFWNGNVIDLAQRVYFQAGRKYDSSSRTLALDILLDSNPSREILQDLLLSLVHHDSSYEVKQYLVQRVKQISEKNENFSRKVNSIKSEFSHLFNNYDVGAQRGLTTAFARNFVTSDYRNGSLSTVLEISKGLLKRGVVDVVIEDSKRSTSLFSLGLFAGGLSSFVSSDNEENDEPDADDVTTAGMELTILGSQIRPFTFFSGQGELMGHVWSGTASEKTPAYQAIVLVIDYADQIPLQNGFLAEIEVLGAVSFDLSGQIQISLWNKNAKSLVEKSAGVSLQGRMRVDSSFVRSRVDFNIATQVSLNLQSDINFYGGNALCMQLSQPEVVIKHNIHKTERIPGGKHRLRVSKYYQTKVPGRSYVLNKKNNEMCNTIFS